jgi:hypothetical protein
LRRVGRLVHDDTTKTQASERVLPLDEELLAILRPHWQNQVEE